MDKDFRNLLIFFGIMGMLVVMFFSSCAYQSHTCKVEAIKAGMKADEVSKACHI